MKNFAGFYITVIIFCFAVSFSGCDNYKTDLKAKSRAARNSKNSVEKTDAATNESDDESAKSDETAAEKAAETNVKAKPVSKQEPAKKPAAEKNTESTQKTAVAKKAEPTPKAASTQKATPAKKPAPAQKPAPAKPQGPKPTAAQADVDAVIAKLKELGEERNTFVLTPSGALTEISINTPSLTIDDVKLIAKLSDLEKLSFTDCRNSNDETMNFTDEFTIALAPLQEHGKLKTLKIGNCPITNDSAETIAGFNSLVDLNLERSPQFGDAGVRKFVNMDKLERLNLIYTGLTETGMMSVRKIPNLKVLDIRGCTVIANTGMNSVAKMPNLRTFQHRSGAVTDDGVEKLTACTNIDSLFLQDFDLTDKAGESLSKFEKLASLQLFRCGGIGSKGLLELKGKPLNRLTLRGLDNFTDEGLALFKDLPKLKRLYLIELSAVTDEGIANLADLAGTLEVLEINNLPKFTDESLKTIAQLKNLKELKIALSAITDKELKLLVDLPKLESLQLIDNGSVDEKVAREIFANKKLKVANFGKTSGDAAE
ncbi:MAG: hypothetical protein ACRC2T_11340 [Thermoguttaceae bacterium]